MAQTCLSHFKEPKTTLNKLKKKCKKKIIFFGVVLGTRSHYCKAHQFRTRISAYLILINQIYSLFFSFSHPLFSEQPNR
jgi:hypothetical protein